MIQIRFAEPADMPRLIEMGMDFLASTPRYREMVPGNPQALQYHFSQIMSDENAAFFVLGEPGNAFGMLAAVRGRQPHSGLLTVAELFWWVSPGHRGHGDLLRRALFEWTKSLGAQRLQMTSPSKKVSSVYRKRFKMQKLEEVYIMKVA